MILNIFAYRKRKSETRPERNCIDARTKIFIVVAFIDFVCLILNYLLSLFAVISLFGDYSPRFYVEISLSAVTLINSLNLPVISVAYLTFDPELIKIN